MILVYNVPTETNSCGSKRTEVRILNDSLAETRALGLGWQVSSDHLRIQADTLS